MTGGSLVPVADWVGAVVVGGFVGTVLVPEVDVGVVIAGAGVYGYELAIRAADRLVSDGNG